MASAEEKLQYILLVLKHTDLNQPDYMAVAQEMGHVSKNAAQKKFKAYIEQAGFKFVDRQVVANDAEPNEKPRSKGVTISTKGKSKNSASNTDNKSTSTSSYSETTRPATKKSPPKTNQQTARDQNVRATKRRRVDDNDDVIEISDDEEVKLDIRVKPEPGGSGSGDVFGSGSGSHPPHASVTTDNEATDEEDQELIAERHRRSRSRSCTVRHET